MEHFSKYFEVTGNRNLGFFVFSSLYGAANSFGITAFNNWFFEKIKQSRNVDMEDEEDWWKLWERLF